LVSLKRFQPGLTVLIGIAKIVHSVVMALPGHRLAGWIIEKEPFGPLLVFSKIVADISCFAVDDKFIQMMAWRNQRDRSSEHGFNG
jgi:hypothetical protein